MFKKIDTNKILNDKNFSFEERLKNLLNLVKPNNFTRLIKISYENFKTDFDKLFEKIGKRDFTYINLYLQNKLFKCPICFKFSTHKTCSKECSKEYPFVVLELKDLMKTNTFKESLKILLEKYKPYKFTTIIKKINKHFEKEFKDLLNEIGTDDFRYINLYLQNKLTKCKVCGKITIKPQKYCSTKCFCKERDLEQINSKKNYKKIGEKISECQKNFSKTKKEEIQKKIEQTKLKRYGDKFYTNREKSKKTNLERYGQENYCSSETFKKQIKEIMNSKTKEEMSLMVERVKKTKKKLYNDENFNNSLRNIKNKELFLKEYILENFVEDDCFLFQKFKEFFDVCNCTVYSCIEKFNLPYKKHKGYSQSEKELFNWIPLENKISNTRKIIKPYELDIYLPDYKLAIEFNGSYWHSTKQKPSDYHLKKTRLCNSKGIELIHIFDFDDKEIVKSIINDRLNKSKIINSEKCLLKEVSKYEAKDFLKENDLKGICRFKKSKGLFFENKLVQLICIEKNEIKRLTTLKNFNIINGVERLTKDLKGFIYRLDLRFEKDLKGFEEIKRIDKHYFIKGNLKIYDSGLKILRRV